MGDTDRRTGKQQGRQIDSRADSQTGLSTDKCRKCKKTDSATDLQRETDRLEIGEKDFPLKPFFSLCHHD